MATTNYINTGVQVDNTSSQQFDYKPSALYQMNQRWQNEKQAREAAKNQLTLQNLDVKKAQAEQMEWESEAPVRQAQRELKLQQTNYQKDLEKRQEKFNLSMAELKSDPRFIELSQNLAMDTMEFDSRMKQVENEQLTLDQMVQGSNQFYEAAKKYQKSPNAANREQALVELQLAREFYSKMGMEEAVAEISDDVDLEMQEILAVYPTLREQSLGIKGTIKAARTAQAEYAKMQMEHQMNMELEKLKGSLDPGNRMKSLEELVTNILAKPPEQRTDDEDKIAYQYITREVVKGIGDSFFQAYWQPGSRQLIHEAMIKRAQEADPTTPREAIPPPTPIDAVMFMTGMVVDGWAAENLKRDPYPEDEEENPIAGQTPMSNREPAQGAAGPQANLNQAQSVIQQPGQARTGGPTGPNNPMALEGPEVPQITPKHQQLGFTLSGDGKWSFAGIPLVEGQVYNMQGIGELRYKGPDPVLGSSWERP